MKDVLRLLMGIAGMIGGGFAGAVIGALVGVSRDNADDFGGFLTGASVGFLIGFAVIGMLFVGAYASRGRKEAQRDSRV